MAYLSRRARRTRFPRGARDSATNPTEEESQIPVDPRMLIRLDGKLQDRRIADRYSLLEEPDLLSTGDTLFEEVESANQS